MHRHFLPTGRVRYFPCCDYVGEHRFVSRLTGASHQVRVRRKLVDTTYIEGTVPATSAPPFAIADGVRCVTPSELARLDQPHERFVIIGGGKTALDACVWLLERGVPATADPLDQAARGLVDEPQVPAAAHAPPRPLAGHRFAMRSTSIFPRDSPLDPDCVR